MPSEAGERSRSLLAVANEASIEDWYSSVLGPTLIKSVRPRELLRELMTKIACDVAEENQKTKPFAQQFRESPQTMFEMLRAGDAIDASKVELRFIESVARLAPDADDDFRRCLAALRWTETAGIAERWLTCAPLDEDEAKKLGVPATGDCALRASTFIAALAAICREFNRPFALFIDEFEHLARHDTRNQSRRNVTWLKRMVEALSRRNAMVFVSGHWKAWEQQGDFLDRFTGRPALQLVRLATDDITSIVRVIAPDWSQYFLSDAAATLADVTSGNIRRVMTVLYDLYAKAGASEEPVTSKMVTEAAVLRLHRAPEEGFLGTIEQTVRARGGTLERDAILSGERYDGVAWVDGAPRLVIRVLHARDESALLAEGEKMADQIKTIRRTAPRARGLFIALGAVNSDHLRTLDAARTEVDVVDGEDAEIGPKVSKLVVAALADEPAPQKPQSDADAEELRHLRQLRLQALERTESRIKRAGEEFGQDERSTAVRSSITPAADEVTRQKADIERREVIDKLMADERRFDPLLYMTLLRSPIFLASFIGGTAILLFADDVSRYFLSTFYRIDPNVIGSSLIEGLSNHMTQEVNRGYRSILLVFRLSGFLSVAVAIFYLIQNIIALMQFRRFRLQTLENISELKALPALLRRARMVMDQALDKVGARHAADWTQDKLGKEGILDAFSRP